MNCSAQVLFILTCQTYLKTANLEPDFLGNSNNGDRTVYHSADEPTAGGTCSFQVFSKFLGQIIITEISSCL